jgi:hypothetical protein
VKTLTIGIPTRNRPEKLNSLLYNLYLIISNRDDIEVYIIDNSDNYQTSKMISDEIRYKEFKYFRNPQNKGLQYSVYRLIDLSSCKYTWILSDDEMVFEDEFINLLNVLNCNNPDIILFNKFEKGIISGENYIHNHYYESTGLSNTLIKTKLLKSAVKTLKTTNYLYPHTLIILKIASSKDVKVYSTGFKVIKDIDEIKNYKFHTHFILSLNLLYITFQASAEGVSKSSIMNMRSYGKKKLISKIIEYVALSAELDYRLSMYKHIKPYFKYFNMSQYILLIFFISGFVTILDTFLKKYKKRILIKIINIGNKNRFLDTINSSTHLEFNSSEQEDTYI